MRRLIHLLLSPASRLARLCIGEKRLACDVPIAEDPSLHLPVFVELDGTRCEGLWAIIDHLEGTYPERPLTPDDHLARAESLRWLDWAMGPFHEQVTQKIVYEKAAPRFTGSAVRRAPDMNVIRQGREALKPALAAIGKTAEQRGNLAERDCTLGDFAVAAEREERPQSLGRLLRAFGAHEAHDVEAFLESACANPLARIRNRARHNW